MESLLNDALRLNDELADRIQRAAKEYEDYPDKFADRLPDSKLTLTKEARARLVKSTENYLKELEDKILKIENRNNDEFIKAIHPGRISSVATERTAAESSLQTALLLVNTKNKNLILNEVEKAAAHPNRSEFLFSMLEILPTFDFSVEYLDKVIDAAKKNPKIEQYYLSLKISDTIKQIRERINYEKRNLTGGIISNNYSLNKQIRRAKGNVI